MSCKKGLFWGLLYVVITLSACQQERPPDVSGIDVRIELRRFEQELFAIDTNNVEKGLAQLEAKYAAFSEVFFGQLLGSKDPRIAPGGHEAYVAGFLRHEPVRQLYDTCQALYGDFSGLLRNFKQAFQYYKYYFPEQPTPDLTTFVSEYSIGAFIYDEHSLAIGLDFFLGADYPYLQYNQGNANFSAYLTRTFNRDHLVSKTLQPLVDDLLGPPPGNRLLDMMIHNGKKLYILDHLLPYTADSVLLEITPEQVKWLKNNELEMWAYFLKENLLYSSEWQTIRKYIEYSPHSPGMPPEAPGRTANWLGWQIVRAWMKRNPEATMADLIALRDAQQLLDLSKYKPRR